MNKLKIVISFILCLWGGVIISQEYNEESIKKELEKYQSNPKLFYDKLKSLSEKAEKANQNTLKVSEEYLSLLDKKDSLIKIYKNQAVAAKSNTGKVATTTTGNAVPVTNSAAPVTTYNSAKTSASAAIPANKTSATPYRVQLAAFYREDFAKFFGTFNKTLGVQKLDNRNVIEVQGFLDSNEAFEFSQKIKQLGFPGAFVTKYDNNGNREVGFHIVKGNNGNAPVAKSPAAPSKPANYPSYVPVGYQEITNTPKVSATGVTTKPSPVAPTKTSPVIAASAPAAAPAKSPVGVQNILKAPVAAATPAPAQPSAPKALASAQPPAPVKPAPKPTPAPPKSAMPSGKVTTADQLDAAFDQLFNK